MKKNNLIREIIRNVLVETLFNEAYDSQYKSWKRKNVTIRGVREVGEENNSGAMLGRGLYTAALSNRELAKQYGTVYFVVGAIPKNPKVFNSLNEWEIWFYNNLVFKYSKEKGKDYPDRRDFSSETTIEDEMQKLGYDGIIIKGREMVNFNPDDVLYFRNENELFNYYNYNIRENELNEKVEFKDVGDDEGYWDRVKIIAKNKKGEEVGYAVIDMVITPETEFQFIDDEHKYTDDEIEEHFPEDFAAKLEHIEVYHKFRKSGYGKELMDAVVNYVKSRNYKTLYLIASPVGFEPKISLDDLSKFYSKYGFKVVKDYDNAYDMVAQLREVELNKNTDNNYWYHGTPDVSELEKEGGFTQKYLNINYVEDIDIWNKKQEELKKARENGNDSEYFKLLDSVSDLIKTEKIRKPIFLTNDYLTAKTYADPKRAFDYQNAKEKVVKVKLKNKNTVTINAYGDRFRFIDVDKVKKGFLNAGVDYKTLDTIINQLNYNVNLKKGITTNNIAAIGDWLGFDYIDIVGVLDSYHGGAIKSTVRMVFDPNNIEIIND